jgi:citrate lyase subunit beta/citryl-CoA lyase
VARLLRSAHFVPGANEKMLQKALALPADALVLDLEDAVTPANKDSARETIAGWLREVDFGAQRRIVRANSLDTPWGERDLEVTMRSPPDAYLVPKARGVGDLEAIDALLTRLEREHGHTQGSVELMVIATETPDGLLNVRALAGGPRVSALTWGAEDLSAALGATRNRDENGVYLEIFRSARHMTLIAAVAAGVQPLDGVFANVRDLDGLRAECREAAALGFTGKITIHPAQVEVVNEAFTPSADEIEESRALLEAFAEHEKQGEMAFDFRGHMVDAPHFERARKILERAKLAAAD